MMIASAAAGGPFALIGVWLAVVCLMLYFLLYRSLGREHAATFCDRYCREIPSDLPPALVGALMNMGPVDNRAVIATVLDLARRGIVHMDTETATHAHPFLARGEATQRIVRDPAAAALLEPLDARLDSLLFDTAGVDDTLFATQRVDFAYRNGLTTRAGFKAWADLAEEQARERGFVERGGVAAARITIAAGVVLILVAFFLGAMVSLWNLLLLPVAIALIVGARALKRRSREAAELAARYHGLHRYLHDLPTLDETPTATPEMWGQFLVIGALSGIAGKVVAALHTRAPGVVADADFAGAWGWIGADGTGMRSLCDAFEQSFAFAAHAASWTPHGPTGIGLADALMWHGNRPEQPAPHTGTPKR